MLLIANSQNILATYLSGAQVSTITPTSTRQTTAMDFSYANETVCWVHVGDNAAQTQLKCARMPGLKGFVDEHTINISLSLHRKLPALSLEGWGGYGRQESWKLSGTEAGSYTGWLLSGAGEAGGWIQWCVFEAGAELPPSSLSKCLDGPCISGQGLRGQ